MMAVENGRLVCKFCGESEEIKEEYSIKEEIVHKPQVVVREENEDLKVLPKVKVKCPECGNNEAAYWMEQTRSADEAPTRFYRCTKCRFTWREYS